MVLHDTHPQSVEAFPQMVEIVRARNCELLQQERESGEAQELWDIVDDLAFFFQPRQPGRLVQFAPQIQLSEEVLTERQRIVHARARRYCGLEEAPSEVRWRRVTGLPVRRR